MLRLWPHAIAVVGLLLRLTEGLDAAPSFVERFERGQSRRVGTPANEPLDRDKLQDPEVDASAFQHTDAPGGGTIVTGMCAVKPCFAGKDCCCWSSAGTLNASVTPNESEAAEQRKCGAPPPDVEAAGLTLLKALYPGVERGTTGPYLELKNSGQALYDDRDLCCVVDPEDPTVESRKSPTEVITTTPPPPPWEPEPTTAAPTKSAWQMFSEDDVAAADMEASAAAYSKAAQDVKIASADLNDTGQSMVRIFDATRSKREAVAKLRGAMGNFAANEAAAINHFVEAVKARAPGVLTMI